MLAIFIIVFGNSIFLLFRGGFVIESSYFLANYLKMSSTMFLLDVYILFFSIITLFISKNFIKNNSYNSSEYSLVIGFTSLCLMFLHLVDNFFAMAILFECLFVLLLVSSAWLFSKKSIGALLKYFILNILSSGILFLSLFFLYSYFYTLSITQLRWLLPFLTNSVIGTSSVLVQFNFLFIFCSLILLIISIAFKIGIFPGQQYVGDLYGNSPFPVVFYLISTVKPCIFFFFLKLIFVTFINFFFFLKYIYLLLGFASLLYGTIMAYDQFSNIKKFLAYTSIAQYGFLLICVFTGNFLVSFLSLFYLFIYSWFITIFFLSLNSFVSIAYFEINNFNDLKYLNNDPLINFIFVFSIFMIAGLPPFDLFFIKYSLYLLLISKNLFFLCFIVLILHAISFVYYLKIVKSILWENNVFKKFISPNDSNFNLFFYFISIFIIILPGFIDFDNFFILFLDNVFCEIFCYYPIPDDTLDIFMIDRLDVKYEC
jgi:NADH-quinone oxidoreductase subunit N